MHDIAPSVLGLEEPTFPTDSQLDLLHSSGGYLSIRQGGRLAMSLTLAPTDRPVQLDGSILLEPLVGDDARWRRNQKRRLARGEPPSAPPSHAGLEALGWKVDATGHALTMTWTLERSSDRDRLRRDVASSLPMVREGKVHPGVEITVHHTTAAEATGDIFAALFLSVASAAIGAVAGVALLVLLGPGAQSFGNALVGFGPGFLGGSIIGLFSSWYAIGLAARVRWLRARLQTVWIAYDVVVSGVVAAWLAVAIDRP